MILHGVCQVCNTSLWYFKHDRMLKYSLLHSVDIIVEIWDVIGQLGSNRHLSILITPFRHISFNVSVLFMILNYIFVISYYLKLLYNLTFAVGVSKTSGWKLSFEKSQYVFLTFWAFIADHIVRRMKNKGHRPLTKCHSMPVGDWMCEGTHRNQ